MFVEEEGVEQSCGEKGINDATTTTTTTTTKHKFKAAHTLMKGPGRKKPCARPTSTPRSSGETPVRYAGSELR